MTYSTAKRGTGKADEPPKPYKDFPLSPHAAGKWCKSIRDRLVYFGKNPSRCFHKPSGILQLG
jgi:hypothetical protein